MKIVNNGARSRSPDPPVNDRPDPGGGLAGRRSPGDLGGGGWRPGQREAGKSVASAATDEKRDASATMKEARKAAIRIRRSAPARRKRAERMERAAGVVEGGWAEASAAPPAGAIDEAGLVEVPLAQAARIEGSFPVGCPVWYRECTPPQSDGGRFDVRRGTVISLALDVVSRILVYRIEKSKNNPSDADAPRMDLVTEDREIVYAAKCPVLVKAVDNDAEEVQGIIICPRFSAEGTTYSVGYLSQDDGLGIEDDVPATRIRFRGPEAATEAPESGNSTVKDEGDEEDEGIREDKGTEEPAEGPKTGGEEPAARTKEDPNDPEHVAEDAVLQSWVCTWC